jgi:hypothetical protein
MKDEQMKTLNPIGIDLYDYFAAQALNMSLLRTTPKNQKARVANDIADYMVAEKEYRFAKRSRRQFTNNKKESV